MFAIYNVDGCRFRDTLENLRKVRKTQSGPGAQLQSDVAEDETQPVATAGGAKTGAHSSPVPLSKPTGTCFS